MVEVAPHILLLLLLPMMPTTFQLGEIGLFFFYSLELSLTEQEIKEKEFLWKGFGFIPPAFFVLSVVSLWSLGMNSSVQPLDHLPAICLVFPRLATVAPLFLRTPCFPPPLWLPARERHGTTMFRNRGAEDI